jgi:peptidoglycan/xylan/chitin deacetylase (PgdA/CDA1 family)
MSFRSAVKAAIGNAALLPGLRIRTRRSLQRRVNVAYLHFVGERTPLYADFYRGSTLDRFDRDLELLGRHFRFCSLEDVVRGDTGGDARPSLAVTFDDGFDLLRSGVADVLERHGVRATTFVITSTVGNERLMWRNKLSAIRSLGDASSLVAHYNAVTRPAGLPQVASVTQVLAASEQWPMDAKDRLADDLWAAAGLPPLREYLRREQPYFTWDALEEWTARGHGIGLHTSTHPYCSRLSAPEVAREIVEPAASLRQRFKLEFLPFSYPFGARVSRETEDRLFADQVFECAFGIDGFAPRGTPEQRLERAPVEVEAVYSVFGRAFLGLPRRRASGAPRR